MVLSESSMSERWDTADMDSTERNSIYIKELGMTMRQAWGALKKSWRQLKYNMSIGDYESPNKPFEICNGLGERRTLLILNNYLLLYLLK
ncbi:MAG: hypothetical protein WBZ36_31055 [Candidatus Nitrosopolaris sp.]